MQLIPGPWQVVREAGILTGLPRGAAGLAWRWWVADPPVVHVEEAGDDTDVPPELPPRVAPDGSGEPDQPVEDGFGPVLHRCFRVRIEGARCSARELIDRLAADMNRAMVPGVARFDRRPGASRAMLVDDELVVRMPGPWDGPVRVCRRSATSFRLATLAGHLEAGQIEFAARPLEAGTLEFGITTWARAGDPLADLAYNRLGLAKEIQFQLWVHACLRAGALAGGHVPDGVRVRTRTLDWERARTLREERSRSGVVPV